MRVNCGEYIHTLLPSHLSRQSISSLLATSLQNAKFTRPLTRCVAIIVLQSSASNLKRRVESNQGKSGENLSEKQADLALKSHNTTLCAQEKKPRTHDLAKIQAKSCGKYAKINKTKLLFLEFKISCINVAMLVLPVPWCSPMIIRVKV